MIALPFFTAEALRRREGTPLTTANVRRQLRKVLGDAGIEGVSPHLFRRPVATVINEQASLTLASELGRLEPAEVVTVPVTLLPDVPENAWFRRRRNSVIIRTLC